MSKTEKIILGTVQFGLKYGINNKLGKPNFEVIKNILDKAFENNISFLDTAEVYGDAHQIIANYHKTSKNRFEIITKYSSSEKQYPLNLRDRIFWHMKLFDVPYLYGYLFHSYDEFKDVLYNRKHELKEIIDSVFVKKIGVSIYTNEQLEDILNYDFINIVQLPFNLLDNHFLRGDILTEIKRKNIEIHTRSTFLQGLFFKDTNSFSGNMINLKGNIDGINKLCKENNINMIDLALNYPISRLYIDKVVIGVESLAQLEKNINSTKVEINPEIWEVIDHIIVKHKELLNPGKWEK